MDTLFGEGQTGPKILLFLVVVLGLLALAFWLLRRFGGGRLGSAATRGRQPRLAMIDQAAIDNRRRLILIRRDNVEHLLIIGGPTDVVIEQNIVRAAGATVGSRAAGNGDRYAAARSPARRGHHVAAAAGTRAEARGDPARRTRSLRTESARAAAAASADRRRRADPLAGRKRTAG